MRGKRALIAAAVLALIALVWVFDLDRFLRLDYLKSQQEAAQALRAAHPLATAAAFFALYVAVTGLSLPAATVLTLAGGALFGFGQALVLVSFASSAGATLAFLASRYLFRDAVERRAGPWLQALDRGVEREGAFYLFALRLVPVVPFFAVNLAMGLTTMRVRTFYWVSQLGMLPATAVYVNAGVQLGGIASPADLLSPALIAAFTLLGLFPLAARHALNVVRAKCALTRWPRPRRFDRNLVVIGGGAAGLVAAYVAAAARAKVTLVEREKMGGDCLNTGCVPSKALIRSARLLAQSRRAGEFGLAGAPLEADFAAVMERVARVVKQIEPRDSAERYRALGVECLQGSARIASPWEVEVKSGAETRTLTTRAIVIATGARPFVPAIEGIGDVGVLTSDTVWNLRALPRRLLVLGGGPIGCELAQCFARFGARVTVVEQMPRLLPREDPEFSELLEQQFREEGIEIRTAHRALRFAHADGEKMLVCAHGAGEALIAFDQVLCALGRKPESDGLGLQALGIGVGASGAVETNEFLQTAIPNIFACGDVTGRWQFTHMASHQAWYATLNALAGGWWRLRVNETAVSWATFTDPEIARVGLSETEARASGIEYEASRFDFADLDRAIADGETRGRVKLLTAPGSDRILGATIAGERAADLAAEVALAMTAGLGAKRVLRTIHIYPAFAEANRGAASMWQGAHLSPRLLAWAERWNRWRLG